MTTAGNDASTTVTSRDGLVRATLDSTGSLTGLEFATTAFDHGDPATLAQTVLDVVREGTERVRQRIHSAPPPPVPPRPTPKRARRAR
ncbi:DNA-binding protein YbaB [Saccharomonospora amisosensis]|uniref:DNA-binding protein YbaB n=1 Tax=Saccharomonospora amisosensis TaxID=1128677 RepID=A0A7X5UVB6_9PSEU|nr:YbaB/EbfC family nucleoid-associated protein [Saccharomonospora amisosensis]NIJ14368.1 DNA-binding protein YbaB [Saccharomonospora amisosensis]